MDNEVKLAKQRLKEAEDTLDAVRRGQRVWNKASQEWANKTAAIALNGGTTEARWRKLFKDHDQIGKMLASLHHQEVLAIQNVTLARAWLANAQKRAKLP